MTTTRTATKAPITSDKGIIDELRGMGFSDEYVESVRRLIVSLSGREKTGKSHFSCTGKPPIIYLDIDIGTEGVVSKFQEAGKQVLIYKVRFPKQAAKDVYAPLWADLRQRIEKAYTLKEGTMVWDTATEAYELARLARFGKLSQILPHNYTEVNAEWRELLRTAYDSRMSTVFIHKMKPKWVNNIRTADYELSGFAEMDYLSQVNLTTYREDNPEGGIPAFSAFVKDCRQNPNLSGMVLRGPMCTLEFLINLVHSK